MSSTDWWNIDCRNKCLREFKRNLALSFLTCISMVLENKFSVYLLELKC